MDAKALIKGVGGGLGTFLGFVVIPYVILDYIHKSYPELAVGRELGQPILIFGTLIAAVSAAGGFLYAKRRLSAALGAARYGLTICYIYFVIGGAWSGQFGVFNASLGEIQMAVDISGLLMLPIALAAIGICICAAEIAALSVAGRKEARPAYPGYKYCVRCGQAIPADYEFCIYCGAKQK